MQTIERLRSRIESAEGLLDVVKTMKGLSAVHLRQYRAAADALAAYRVTVHRALQVLVRVQPDLLDAEPEQPGGSTAAVLFGSDHGLCGRFQEDLTEHAFAELQRRRIAPEQQQLHAVGQRMAAHLADVAAPRVAGALALPDAVESLADRTRDALVVLERARREDGVGTILLFHHQDRVGAERAPPRTVPLLPLDLRALREQAREPWPTQVLPTFTVEPRVLLASNVREHLFGVLLEAFVASLAAENAARLRTMQAGERNVEEKLDDLRADYHHRRQETITGELLDITAAFQMLRRRR